jgi:hypothetical protein
MVSAHEIGQREDPIMVRLTVHGRLIRVNLWICQKGARGKNLVVRRIRVKLVRTQTLNQRWI